MRIKNTQLIELCQRHVTRFQSLLTGAFGNVRHAECQHYLAIWERGMEWAQSCAPEAVHTEESFAHDEAFQGEVIDACESGSYDAYFEPEGAAA